MAPVTMIPPAQGSAKVRSPFLDIPEEVQGWLRDQEADFRSLPDHPPQLAGDIGGATLQRPEGPMPPSVLAPDGGSMTPTKPRLPSPRWLEGGELSTQIEREAVIPSSSVPLGNTNFHRRNTNIQIPPEGGNAGHTVPYQERSPQVAQEQGRGEVTQAPETQMEVSLDSASPCVGHLNHPAMSPHPGSHRLCGPGYPPVKRPGGQKCLPGRDRNWE